MVILFMINSLGKYKLGEQFIQIDFKNKYALKQGNNNCLYIAVY